ncbi:PhoB family transcriptional regulator [Domibacillus aminovorans]|uniref:PhoB family transcriptional regulator n=2 Tax=Bacillaceae TaxID=186817 RepID=A0A177KZV9_9BACI|nr:MULTISPECIES: response regulator transcription factor [Bacillaceae]OAH58585.1 PhoB family transcriptional regulator [Domibacillus aminovorans]
MEMKIMIIEDDLAIARQMEIRFGQWSFQTVLPVSFHDVMATFIKEEPHLVIVDIQLPAFDGFHWCREIRAVSTVPVLFLSSRDHPMDMVMAMQMGADDYIQKPFHMDVLVAKVQALLRRVYAYGDEPADALQWNGAVIDLKKGMIRHDGEEVDLTKNELFILTVLVDSRDSIVSRETVIKKLWDDAQFVNDNTLTVNVTRLRQKLAGIGLEGSIVTKKGQGYMAVTLS